MKRKQVIKRFCELQTRVCNDAIGWEHAADCFCADRMRPDGDGYNYQNAGKALEFIEQAVQEKIARMNEEG